MHLWIIKITYNRTATHFMDDSFVNLGEDVILTLQRQSGAISLSICYWLFKCWVWHVVCVCVRARKRQLQCRVCVLVCVCSCVCAMRETRSCKHGLFANTYELHYGVCQATQFPFRAWTCDKTKNIISCLYFSFESWRSRFWKGELHFRRVLVVFGQSQCTGSVGHS